MSYVTSGPTHWLRMMYGGEPNHDSYQEMLQTFGRLVKDKVLPAEKKTEMERAQNPLKGLESKLNEKGKFDKESMQTAIAEMRKNEKIPEEVYKQIADFGLPGMVFSENLGGLEVPYPVFMACLETLGKAENALKISICLHRLLRKEEVI